MESTDIRRRPDEPTRGYALRRIGRDASATGHPPNWTRFPSCARKVALQQAHISCRRAWPGGLPACSAVAATVIIRFPPCCSSFVKDFHIGTELYHRPNDAAREPARAPNPRMAYQVHYGSDRSVRSLKLSVTHPMRRSTALDVGSRSRTVAASVIDAIFAIAPGLHSGAYLDRALQIYSKPLKCPRRSESSQPIESAL